MSETIVELKDKAEASLKELRENIKKINDLGFNVHTNADDSIYVFRDVREAYGTQPPPRPPTTGVNPSI